MVLGSPRSDGSTRGKVCRDRCLLLRGVFAQDNEMGLSPQKEETHLFICLAAATVPAEISRKPRNFLASWIIQFMWKHNQLLEGWILKALHTEEKST